ncbi:MAG: peptidoglycan-binding protein [Candidatus Omnitrophota bacterium]|nr:peptidoglycan-binding protein [Candidatus Omnitrophota bacterium]
MRALNIIIGVVLVVMFSGCASLQEVEQLKSQVSSLENNLKDKEDEKSRLEESQRQIEFALKKQLEANLELRQKLQENKDKLEKINRQIEESRSKARMPSGADIQTALKRAGFYKGEIDGNIGPDTKEAIKRFQEMNGLNPDGVVGSRTWEILSKYLADGENLK